MKADRHNLQRAGILAAVCGLIVAIVFVQPANAAIGFRAAASANNGGGSTTLSIAMPTGTVTDDVMIAIVSVRGGTGVTITPPAGWKTINSNDSTTVLKSTVYYKFAASGEAGPYTFTFSGSGGKASGVISSYSGVGKLAPINVNGNQVNASNTVMTAPSVMTTQVSTWVIAAFSTAAGTTVAQGGGMTQRGVNASTGGSAATRTTTELQDIVQAGAGASGTMTATAGASAVNIGHAVALTPKLNMKMSAYRWFANADSTTPGAALAAQNTTASTGAGPVRLQMLTHVEEGTTTPYHGVKLKYSLRGADNVCDASGTNETYQDIVTRTKTKAAFAATAANDSSIGTQPWNTPQNAADTPDSSAAVATLDNSTPTSNYLKLTGFGFSVPSTATIYGIKIRTNAWADTYSAGSEEASLLAYVVKANSVQTTSSSQLLTSTASTNYIDFPDSMYGTTLTPADVNSSTFGVALEGSVSLSSLGINVSVSSLSVQVIYSDGGTVMFQQNATPADGAVAVNGGLTHSTDAITLGSYNESNIASLQPNAAQQTSGDLLQDYSLDLTSLTPGTYCFMAFRDDDSALGTTHDVVPELTILDVQVGQANYRWYSNADSSAPGAPLAAQDTSAVVSSGVPFRLRQRLSVDTVGMALSGLKYKLQYAEKVGACDTSFTGETYSDLLPITASSASSSLSSTYNDSSIGTEPWTSVNEAGNAANDGYWASVSAPQLTGTYDSYWVKSQSHVFSVPANATITGIEVIYVAESSVVSGAASINQVRLVRAGVIEPGGKTPTTPLSGGFGSITYGSPTDLWGASWTPADINSTMFGTVMNVRLTGQGSGAGVDVDNIQVNVYYTTPSTPGVITYYDNPTPADSLTISSTGSDPVNASRPTVYQNYHEADPFTNSVATIPSGSDGLWDFAVISSSAGVGKSYCVRTVKSDGSLLNGYNYIPEIVVSSGSSGPTLDQQMRGGQSVVNGSKGSLIW